MRQPRLVMVSGVYPPDIGGPATHTADISLELSTRGHEVTVLTLTNEHRMSARPGLVRFPRRWPWPVRTAAVAGWLIRRRRDYDAAYSTGLIHAAVLGARMAGRPVVVKVVGDPAWERATRLGLTSSDFERFGAGRDSDPRVRAMEAARNWALRSASALTAPSESLARRIREWLGPGAPVHVIPNGARVPPGLRYEGRPGELRAVFVGRLVGLKRVDVLIRAVGAVDGARLDVIGGGPERETLESMVAALGVESKVTFLGQLDHDAALRRIAASDVLLLASEHEGLPHAAIEALSCGTPVVAPRVGGITDLVSDGRNGLLFEGSLAESLAPVLARLHSEEGLLTSLRERAARDGQQWRIERVADALELLLERIIERGGKAA